MMRDSTTTTSPYALACVTPSSGVTFQYRATESTAAVVKATINGVAAPCWLRLVRAGSNFTAFYATDTDGVAGAWQPIGAAQAITFAGRDQRHRPRRHQQGGRHGLHRRLRSSRRHGESRRRAHRHAHADRRRIRHRRSSRSRRATARRRRTRTFNVLVDGAPPSTSVWNATTTGSLLWSTGANWSGGTPPPNSRFSTVEFFTGQTFAAGTITSSNDTAIGHAMNVLTLGGTGPDDRHDHGFHHRQSARLPPGNACSLPW